MDQEENNDLKNIPSKMDARKLVSRLTDVIGELQEIKLQLIVDKRDIVLVDDAILDYEEQERDNFRRRVQMENLYDELECD